MKKILLYIFLVLFPAQVKSMGLPGGGLGLRLVAARSASVLATLGYGSLVSENQGVLESGKDNSAEDPAVASEQVEDNVEPISEIQPTKKKTKKQYKSTQDAEVSADKAELIEQDDPDSCLQKYKDQAFSSSLEVIQIKDITQAIKHFKEQGDPVIEELLPAIICFLYEVHWDNTEQYKFEELVLFLKMINPSFDMKKIPVEKTLIEVEKTLIEVEEVFSDYVLSLCGQQSVTQDFGLLMQIMNLVRLANDLTKNIETSQADVWWLLPFHASVFQESIQRDSFGGGSVDLVKSIKKGYSLIAQWRCFFYQGYNFGDNYDEYNKMRYDREYVMKKLATSDSPLANILHDLFMRWEVLKKEKKFTTLENLHAWEPLRHVVDTTHKPTQFLYMALHQIATTKKCLPSFIGKSNKGVLHVFSFPKRPDECLLVDTNKTVDDLDVLRSERDIAKLVKDIAGGAAKKNKKKKRKKRKKRNAPAAQAFASSSKDTEYPEGPFEDDAEDILAKMCVSCLEQHDHGAAADDGNSTLRFDRFTLSIKDWKNRADAPTLYGDYHRPNGRRRRIMDAELAACRGNHDMAWENIIRRHSVPFQVLTYVEKGSIGRVVASDDETRITIPGIFRDHKSDIHEYGIQEIFINHKKQDTCYHCFFNPVTKQKFAQDYSDFVLHHIPSQQEDTWTLRSRLAEEYREGAQWEIEERNDVVIFSNFEKQWEYIFYKNK